MVEIFKKQIEIAGVVRFFCCFINVVRILFLLTFYSVS